MQNFVKNDTTIQRIFIHITNGEYDSLFFKLHFVYYTFNFVLLCRHTIECVFCDEYIKVIIDLVRDDNVDAPYLAIQHSRLQVCGALTHGRH